MDKDHQQTKDSVLPAFDTLEVVQLLGSYKKRIIRWTVAFFLIGILLAVISPKEYTSSVIMVPQMSSGKGLGKKFSNIASLVGLDIEKNTGGIIFPNLYPLIAKSSPFRKRLVYAPIYVKSLDSAVPVEYYLSQIRKPNKVDILKSYTIGLPGRLAKALRGSSTEEGSLIHDSIVDIISKEERLVNEFLETNLVVNFNENEGFIKIEGTLDSPIGSAQLVTLSQKYLQEIIIEHNIQKAKDELAYIEDRYLEAEDDFFKKRSAIGNFKDSNKNLVTSASLWRLDQLKAEFDLAFTLYTQLGSQLETTKLQVKKDTPVFTIIKPATVPMEPSSPSPIVIIIQTVFLGLFLYVFFIIARFYVIKIKHSLLTHQ